MIRISLLSIVRSEDKQGMLKNVPFRHYAVYWFRVDELFHTARQKSTQIIPYIHASTYRDASPSNRRIFRTFDFDHSSRRSCDTFLEKIFLDFLFKINSKSLKKNFQKNLNWPLVTTNSVIQVFFLKSLKANMTS